MVSLSEGLKIHSSVPELKKKYYLTGSYFGKEIEIWPRKVLTYRVIMETPADQGWRVSRSSDKKDIFATLCQSHFCGVLEAEHRWGLVEACTGGDEGREGEEDVTSITFEQLG